MTLESALQIERRNLSSDLQKSFSDMGQG